VIQVDNKWYAFDDYSDEHLNARIAYWERCEPGDFCNILGSMYAELDRRVDEKLLAWVESK